MRIILMTNYLCLDNGIASLHQKLAAQLTIHLRAPVSSLVMAEGRVVGVLLADGRRIEADAVICAAVRPCAGWGGWRFGRLRQLPLSH